MKVNTKMIKVRVEYSDGQYFASLLEDDEAIKFEELGYCVVSIPESKAVEWGLFLDKQKEWHHYWRNLSNQFFDKIT